MTDWEMICAYREASGERAEELFAGIVGRHVNLVYSVARRRMGDEHLARDVTQEVFLTLARKGRGLGEEVLLSGWLFETTRFVCLAMLRAERRRVKREREVAMRTDVAGGDEVMWAAIEGEVDEAVAQLGRKEREVVLLRFFEGKTHGEVARVLAISEEAAKKRTERAVESLRGILGRRGKVAMGAGLAGVLGAHAVEAAPSGIAGAVVKAAGMGVKPLGLAASGWLAGTAAMKLVAAVVVAAVVLPVGVLVWRGTHEVKAGKSEAVAGALPTTAVPVPVAAENRVSGQVVDVEEKPVAGAQVYVTGQNKDGDIQVVGSVMSDGDGRFLVSINGEGAQVFAVVRGVGISAPVRLPEAMVRLALLPAVNAEVTLEGPDGKPAAGVEAHVADLVFEDPGQSFPEFLTFEGKLAGLFSGKTDGQGKCVLRGLPQGVRALFDTSDERFAHTSFLSESELDPEGTVVHVSTIRLQSASTVTGKLLAPDTGKPLVGWEIGAQVMEGEDSGVGGESVTDGEGKFVIKRMSKGSYVVTLAEEDNKPNAWVAAGVDVKLAEGETAQVNMVLTRGGLLKGKVRDAVTKKGIAGVGVGLHGPSKPAYAASIYGRDVDSEGRFEFRVPAGEQHPYFAAVVPDGYLPPEKQGMQSVMVKEGETVETAIELQPDPSPVVRGTVVGPDEKGIAGATVKVDDKTGQMMMESKEVITDEEGRFTVHTKRGVMLRAKWKDLGTLAAVRVVGESPVELVVEPNATFTLIAEMVDSAGDPVPHASAELFTETGFYGMGGPYRRADADGRVRFEGLPMDGRFSLEGKALGYGVSSGKVGHAPIEGDREVVSVIRLRKADAKVGVLVVDKNDKPVAGVHLAINCSQIDVREGHTDAEGRFSFAIVEGAHVDIAIITDKREFLHSTKAVAGDEAVKIVYTPGEEKGAGK